MNRTVLIVIVIVVVAAVGGYYYTQQNAEVAGGESAAGAAATTEVPAAVQVAIDFCKEKGGTVETETIAEGVTHLCVMADGTKAEVSKYMADNKTE